MPSSPSPSPESAAETGAPRSRARQLALTGLSLAVLLSSLDTSVVHIALPALAREFGASFREVQWIVLSYLLAISTMIVGAGRLGDILGRRRVFLAGVTVFTLASVVCAAAPNLSVLLAARAVQGFGAAAMLALSVAMVGSVVPAERTGSAMGLLGAMSATGTAAGPGAGGLLIAAFGWRSAFLVNVPLGIAVLALAVSSIPPDAPRRATTRSAFDVPGTVLLAGSLAAYSMSVTGDEGRAPWVRASLLGVAVAGAYLFARVESVSAAPLLPPRVLREPAVRLGLVRSALVSAVMMATLVVGPFYLSAALGLATSVAGLAMSVGPVVSAIVGVPAGRMVDRAGADRAANAGLVAIAAGTGLLAVLPRTGGLLAWLLPIVVTTAGYALFQAANGAQVVAATPDSDRGVASAALGLARNLGLVSGAAVLGAVFASRAERGESGMSGAEDVAAGKSLCFAAACAVAGLALAAGLRRRGAAGAPAPDSGDAGPRPV